MRWDPRWKLHVWNTLNHFEHVLRVLADLVFVVYLPIFLIFRVVIIIVWIVFFPNWSHFYLRCVLLFLQLCQIIPPFAKRFGSAQQGWKPLGWDLTVKDGDWMGSFWYWSSHDRKWGQHSIACPHMYNINVPHMYIHIYIAKKALVHACIHTYVRTYIHTYLRKYIHTCMHRCMHAWMHS